jgi:exosome complex RNA-binding protein Csl4
MDISDGQLVLPGDMLATEEEAAPSDNTYVDEGCIYSSIIGHASVKDGKISVHNHINEMRKIEKGMLVIGTVTDDLPAVSFVKIGTMFVDGKKYIAVKDGKLLVPKPRSEGFGRGRHDDRRGGGGFSQPGAKMPRLCSSGDVILARVLDDADDIYLLGVRDPECGVILSSCEVCGSKMGFNGRGLSCPSCSHRQTRKVSQYYGRTEDIKRLFQ